MPAQLADYPTVSATRSFADDYDSGKAGREASQLDGPAPSTCRPGRPQQTSACKSTSGASWPSTGDPRQVALARLCRGSHAAILALRIPLIAPAHLFAHMNKKPSRTQHRPLRSLGDRVRYGGQERRWGDWQPPAPHGVRRRLGSRRKPRPQRRTPGRSGGPAKCVCDFDGKTRRRCCFGGVGEGRADGDAGARGGLFLRSLPHSGRSRKVKSAVVHLLLTAS